MVELIPRSRLTKTMETAPAALGADPDARVRVPKFGLSSHIDQGSVEVVCEITWDGIVWSELGRDVFTPDSKARDGSPASVAYALTVWGEDDKPRSPLASRYRLIPIGGPTLEAAVTERREPTAKPQVRHHSIAIVQSAEKVTTGAGTTLAYGSNVVQDNLLCVTHSAYSSVVNTIGTPTDTRSNSYAGINAEVGDGNVSLRSYYAVCASSGACTVTFSASNGLDLTVVVSEFSGAATTTPLDGGSTGTGTSTAPSSGNVTPSEGNCLLYAAVMHNGGDTSFTEEAGWSLVQEHEGGSADMPVAVIYKVQTTAATEDADWTLGASRQWWATVGVFKAAAAGASGTGAFTQPMQVLSGTGKKAYPGTGTLVQPTQQVAGTGVMLPDGSGSLIQPVQVLAGTGKKGYPGTGALVQPVQLLAGSGKQVFAGAGSLIQPVQVLTGSGVKGYPGVGALTQPMQLLAGTGKKAYPGVGTLTLPAQILAGTGKQAILGSGAFVLPMQLLAGTGAAGGLSGTGAFTQPVQLLSGSGVMVPTGTGAFILPAQVLTGAGAAGGVVGTGALVQPVQAIAGSGKQLIPGVGAFAVPVQVLTGAGKQTFAGAGALTQPMQVLAGSGVKGYPGTGSLAVPVQVLVGAGKQVIPGSGSFAVPVQVLIGAGLMVPSGVGAFVLPMQLLAGTGLGGAVPDVLGRVLVFDEPAWRVTIFDEPVWRVLVFDEPVWRVTVTD